MIVAAIQHDVVWEDRDANLARLAARVDQAVGLGAGLVVLCEMFATGFSMDTATVAEPTGGPTTAWLVERAAAGGAWVCGTAAERDEGSRRPFNRFVLAGPDGTVHRSAKLHPFSLAGEHDHYAAGDRPLTVEIGGLRVSPLVCYDLRFADAAWAMGPGTDLFVVPANWPASRREHWRTLLRARAIENQCYAVGVNRVGEGGGVAYGGDSAIVDPAGRTLVEAGDTETIIAAEVDPETVATVRERWPFLADRRRGT